MEIEGQLKNMMSSLRAVSELKNTAIKDRHWLQLMAETGVNKIIFKISYASCLKDAFNILLLYNFR